MDWMGLSAVAWLIALGIVVLGSVLQGSMGFGLGLLASPVMALLDRSLVPGVVIGMGVPLALLIAWREREALDVGVVKWAIAGRLPGSVLGSIAVVALGTRALAVGFALSIFIAVALSIVGITVVRNAQTMVTAGFISGLMGTATSVGGPPMALVFQNDTGPQLRAALATFMAFGALFSLSLLAIVGEFRLRELTIAAALMPASVLGFTISGRTNQYLDRGYTRPAVLIVAAAAATAVLVRALLLT